MFLGEAKTPDNTRLYAIGDVHGCDDLLAEAHRKIVADLRDIPVAGYRIVHVGDYVDRGPNSAAVIERLAGLAGDPRIVCLRGNHDQLMLDFLADPVGAGANWFDNGGATTLGDYGVSSDRWSYGRRDLLRLGDSFAAILPPRHRNFLEGLRPFVKLGDFVFCHAGIRPGIPLAAQSAEDLTWIRDEFLNDSRDHGFVVVHGHTPAAQPEVRRNRINVDTGAVYRGLLTVLALEGANYRFL